MSDCISNAELNIKGEICPFTFVKSKLALEKMKKGEILRVIVDYEPAIRNVPRSMEEQGHKVLSTGKINDTDYEIIVEKDG
ncbi:MAG TPA: sulfurtransferase TusA family protein, partial [bacterium]|nr:sulfurtransferase TusA family protein [bacterium]